MSDLGSFLTDTPRQSKPVKRESKHALGRRAILAALADGPATVRELVRRTGLTRDGVTAPLQWLLRHGHVERAGEQPRADARRWGRRVEVIYRARSGLRVE